MLFHRISQDLKAQNWSAIWLDLAVVVVGIFLGLQANAWNESRQDRVREAEILDHLRADFEEIKSEADEALDFHRGTIVGLNTVLRSLETGTVVQDDEDTFIHGLQHALMLDTGPRRSGTYIDLVSGGQLRLIRNEELRSRLSEYDEFQQKGNLIFSQFWEGQRLHEIAFGRHFNYVTSRRREGDMFFPGEIVAYNIAAMAADQEFQRAAQRLTEYQVYYQIWHNHMAQAAQDVLLLL